MATDPVARALVSAAGVGLFPHNGDDIYSGVRLRLLMLGYTWNRVLQSRMIDLSAFASICALTGPTSKSAAALAENVVNAADYARQALFGYKPETGKREVRDPVEEYRRVFGDVDFEELEKLIKSKST